MLDPGNAVRRKPTAVEGLRALAALIKATVVLVVLGVVGWAVLAACFSHPANTASTSAVHHPPTADERFLYILKSHAWLSNPDGDAGLIGIGHSTCGALGEGDSRAAIRRVLQQGPGLSDSEASWVITAAAVAYCPEFVSPSDTWMEPT